MIKLSLKNRELTNVYFDKIRNIFLNILEHGKVE